MNGIGADVVDTYPTIGFPRNLMHIPPIQPFWIIRNRWGHSKVLRRKVGGPIPYVVQDNEG